MNKLFKAVLAILLTSIFISGDVKAETRQLVEGEDYKVMAPKGTKTPQVLEFFNYACGACYSMESFVTKFKQENTEIKVTPVPMDLGHQQWTIYVKAFYMGELLKVLDKSHAKMFHRINIEKKQITSEEGLKTFFIELGVDSVSYDKADKSFALSSKLRKAKQLARKYQVSGTPTFVANRRFRLDNSRLESTEMIEKALKDLTTITL